MFEWLRKLRTRRTEVEEAEKILEKVGINIYELGLPMLSRPGEDIFGDDRYYHKWFEGLAVKQEQRGSETVTKVTGRYAAQCKTSRQVGGLWKPSLPSYCQLSK